MAMNNSNYGYSPSGYPASSFSPSGYSSPYSSTPTGIRSQRPRFGYSGPSMYPRPRSSASKPNPNSFSDSMINNYGTSASRIDTTFNSENENLYNDSYNSSNYYTANESFYSNQSHGDTSMLRNNSLMYDNSNMLSNNPNIRGDRSLLYGDTQVSAVTKLNSQFGLPNFYNSTTNNTGSFQKKPTFTFGEKSSKPAFPKKFSKSKMASVAKQGTWRCELCSLDFTSQIPYDMHIRGAKHAKKLKAKQALSAVQLQAVKSPDGEKSFFCELCNVKANSSLQLQTHLEGSKHKSKLQPKEPKEQSQDNSEESKIEVNNPSIASNVKTNGSLTRSLPSDFGEPQPSKLRRYACDVCNVTVNSEIQLQQHLSSKKHQNKLEGKPVNKGKKNKEENKAVSESDVTESVVQSEYESTVSNEPTTKVVGVKTLASSFVQGETLH